ncbi:MAG: CotH kinase family protein [Bacteroidales bacterium]|nr:CotH kinase family protein [Bacteroidales bacterium]MDT8431595.1 CotH kinase family protein [Bacteroidales bacterium]
MRRFVCTILTGLLLTQVVSAQQTLPDSVKSHLVLQDNNVPYHIAERLVITAGATLEIEEGVQLIIGHNIPVRIEGRLLVNGTENRPVLFTTAQEGERWRYIYSTGTLIARHLHVSNAVRFLNSYGDTVIIEHCKVENTYGTAGDDCIGAHDGQKVLIRNNTLTGNPAAGKTDALDLDNISDDTISGNTISMFSDDGIDIGTRSSGILISENTISHCEMGISVGESSTAVVHRNLITHCLGGIQSHFGSVVEATNNTLYSNMLGIRAYHNYSEETSGGTAHISNTIVSGGSKIFALKPNSVVSFNYCLTDSVPLEGVGNITGDPMFRDTTAGDFSLRAGSPAIDAGDPDTDGDGIFFPDDPDGMDRDGSRIDIGRYPYYNSSLRFVEATSSNLSMKMDDLQGWPDWFCLKNTSSSSINLNGYYLSDDPEKPLKHQVSTDLYLAPGDTVCFWADGMQPPTTFHLPFKLSGEGEFLVLSNPDGYLMEQVVLPLIPVNHVYKRVGITDEWMYYPYPAVEDTVFYSALSGTPEFNSTGGAVDFPVTVAMRSSLEGDSLYYSLDGSDPFPGDRFTSPVEISGPATLRVKPMQADHVPGFIHSLAFFEQNAYPLPVISLSTNEEHLYGETGIYANYNRSGPRWERPASVTWYNGTDHFSIIAGIRIQGGNSVFMPKKSFRLHFRGGYGASRLAATPFREGPASFRNLVLRAGYDDDITSYNGTLLRDPFSTELWSKLGELATQSTFNVLLLNNAYWGIYNTRESINEYFVEDNLGFKNFDLVRFQKDGPDLKVGSWTEWNRLQHYFDTTDFARAEAYDEVSSFMDMNSFLNLLSLVHCAQFRSWTWGAFMIKPDGGRWRWTIWDTDRSYNTVSWNGFTEYANTSAEKWPNFMPRKLLHNEQFRNALINRNCDLLNSLFVPGNAIAVYDSLVNILRPAMEAEFDRWNPGNSDRWDVNNESIRNFLRERPGYLYEQMKSYFSIADTTHLQIRIIGDGKVQLNSLLLDGPSWKGAYMSGIPVDLKAIPDPGSSFIEWQGVSGNHSISLDPAGRLLITAVFDTSSLPGREAVVINELMYHPVDEAYSEWVELYNPNDLSVSLDGFTLTDGGINNLFQIPQGTVIDPHGYLVIAGKMNSFMAEFGTIDNLTGDFNGGESGFNLSNSGEIITLRNSHGLTEDVVPYSDHAPWPGFADGYGPSLQLKSPDLDNTDPFNWYASIQQFHTPGRANEGAAGVKPGVASYTLNVYPNPMGEELHLQLSGSLASEVFVQLYSMSGTKLRETNFNYIPGASSFRWIHGLTEPGAYILRVTGAAFADVPALSRLVIYSGR